MSGHDFMKLAGPTAIALLIAASSRMAIGQSKLASWR